MGQLRLQIGRIRLNTAMGWFVRGSVQMSFIGGIAINFLISNVFFRVRV